MKGIEVRERECGRKKEKGRGMKEIEVRERECGRTKEKGRERES